MANFIGGAQALNSKVQIGIKGKFTLTGSRVYSSFFKSNTLTGIKGFTASKSIASTGSNSNLVTRTTGQLFP